MAVVGPSKTFEFWLGRAGSGKTRACIEAIARTASDQPRGPMLLWLVPEQATAQAEYELAAQSGLPGYTRAQVISFDHLRREVFRRLGGRPAGVIDETARVMLLRQVIRARRESLKILGSGASVPGLAESVSAALLEFQRYGWNRGDLRAGRDEIRGRLAAKKGEKSSLLEMKLADLETVWEAYDAELAARGLHDGAALGPLVTEKIAHWPELDGARLWIDGFASFTSEETRLLDALLNKCEAAAMTLCLDPADKTFGARDRIAGDPDRPRVPRIEMILGPSKRIGAERAFENLEVTFFELRDRLVEEGWKVGQVDFPREGQPATRFSGSRALKHLESRVLTRLRAEPFDEASWNEDGARFEAWPPGPVEMIEADQTSAEIEAVARRLAALCAGGVCWREMAVIARGLDHYAPLVREIFPRYGIPFFLDERRGVAGHPVVRLLVSALEIAGRDWHSDAVREYLKSGLSPLDDRDTIARIERLADRCRLRGGDWFDAALWKDEKRRDGWRGESGAGVVLFQAWMEAAAPLRALRRDLAAVGADPAEALWKFLTDCGAGARIAQWAADARAQGDEETALLHLEAWKETVGLLDRVHQIGLASVLAGDPASVAAELLEIIEAGLASVRAGLIPPTLDQVLVGAVDRTRTPPVRAAFVIGLNDGEFPRMCEEDPFFGDRERRDLTHGGRALGPDSRHRFDHERFLAYVALTRASEYLCLSRSAGTGPAGAAGGPSPFFRAVAEALPMTAPQIVRAESAGEFQTVSPILAEAWARGLAQSVHAAARGEDPEPLAQALASPHPLEIDAWQREGNHATHERVRATLAALEPPRPAALDPELALRFWRAHPSLSVTGLETYAACPYKFFVERMLRLERPADPMPGPPALGSLRHEILHMLFNRLQREGRLDWGGINVAGAQALIPAYARELMEGKLADEFGRDELTRRVAEMVVEELKLFVVALHAMGRRYGFDQIKAEHKIHEGDHPLRIEAAPGLTVDLKGTIDRVDASRNPSGENRWMLVFDYKASKNKLDLSRLWDGAELQLPAYALAVEAAGRGWKVGGFFYWPMAMKLSEAEGMSEEWADPGSEKWFKNHRPAGCFVEEVHALLDREVAGGEPALAFNFKLKNDGGLSGNAGQWLKAAEMRTLLDRVAGLMRERAERIVLGAIPQQPIVQGSARECDRCDHAARCRLTAFPSGMERPIAGLKNIGALRKLVKAKGGSA